MHRPSRILVVDDDDSIRKVLETILMDKGYVVDTAENGRKAIQISKTGFYNLALIDIRLPDIEGTELLQKLRETTPRMRKIMITGYPSVQNAVDALNHGADAYIVKPFDVEKALECIAEQLQEQDAEREYSQEKVTEFIETRVRELEKEKNA